MLLFLVLKFPGFTGNFRDHLNSLCWRQTAHLLGGCQRQATSLRSWRLATATCLLSVTLERLPGQNQEQAMIPGSWRLAIATCLLITMRFPRPSCPCSHMYDSFITAPGWHPSHGSRFSMLDLPHPCES